MAAVPLAREAASSGPKLFRFVVEDPVGDDLVHRKVKLGVHRFASDLALRLPFLDRLSEPRMFRSDQKPTIVLLLRVEEVHVDILERDSCTIVMADVRVASR